MRRLIAPATLGLLAALVLATVVATAAARPSVRVLEGHLHPVATQGSAAPGSASAPAGSALRLRGTTAAGGRPIPVGRVTAVLVPGAATIPVPAATALAGGLLAALVTALGIAVLAGLSRGRRSAGATLRLVEGSGEQARSEEDEESHRKAA